MWLLPPEWALLRGPIGLVVLVFVVAFPFRVFIAVLQGLQDLAFVGATQLASWAAGTVVTIAGVVRRLRAVLTRRSGGWPRRAVSAGHGVGSSRCARFLKSCLAQLPSLTLAALRQQIGRGAWISVGQLAQVLLSGTDLVVIGKLLGPEAVVPYACTGKLITMLANQPQMFMQLALPALSELRTSATRASPLRVSREA